MFGKLKSSTTVSIGDRFVKADDPTTVWIVTGEGSDVSAIQHYQVCKEGQQTRQRTLSESTLLNRDFYHRVG